MYVYIYTCIHIYTCVYKISLIISRLKLQQRKQNCPTQFCLSSSNTWSAFYNFFFILIIVDNLILIQNLISKVCPQINMHI